MTDTIPPGASSPSDGEGQDPSAEPADGREPNVFDRVAGSPLLRLGILVVGLGYAAFVSVWLFVFIMAIVLSVFLHELGHFLVAKRSGMKVTEFFIGFGPRIWSFRRGETEYGLKFIPAGAYVKIIGMSNLEEVAPEDEARSYRAKSFGKRMPVVLGGPAMNLALGFLLLFVVIAAFGKPSETLWQVRSVTVGSAAEAAGLERGDRLIAFEGQPIGEFSDLSGMVRAHSGSSVELTVERDGQELQVPVTLGWSLWSNAATQLGLKENDTVTKVGDQAVANYDELVAALARADGETSISYSRDQEARTTAVAAPIQLPEDGSKGFLGVGQEAVLIPQSVADSAGATVDQFGSIISTSVQGMGRLFSPSGITHLFHLVTNAGSDASVPATTGSTGPSSPDQSPAPAASSSSSGDEDRPMSILGIISVGTQVGETAGWAGVLTLLAIVNIFLGLINLVPLLPFDGGHIAVSIYEEIRSRIGHRQYRVDMAKLLPVTYVVLLLVVGLMVSTVYLDLADPVSIK